MSNQPPTFKPQPVASRVAVCSWSLQPADPEDLASKIGLTGIPRIQLALDPLRESPAWAAAPALLSQKGIAIVSGMFGCVGEDYTSLESIRRTGGIAPDSTWDRNLANIEAAAALATQLGLKLVTFHAGFLPHDQTDPAFKKLRQRLLTVADIFNGCGIDLGLETGQETGSALADFLQSLNRPNVGVNFDPANMILYDKGDPVAALRMLGPWIRQVHIKDAVRTKTPGLWGTEVPAGSGQVDWPEFFKTLAEIGFKGNLVIEREAGNQRVEDIRAARAVIQQPLAPSI